MPVISVTSPKGGVGKTTTATLLSTILAERGISVILIDADPNGAVSLWAARGAGVPKNLQVVPAGAPNEFVRQIDASAATAAYVVVDLEGRAGQMAAYATALSDFVIIPTQGSQLDAEQTVRHIQLIEDQERVSRRRIPFAVIFTRTSAAVRPTGQAFIQASFAEDGIPTFATQIADREAYRAIFSFGGTLAGLKDSGARVGKLSSAIENADAFVDELLQQVAA